MLEWIIEFLSPLFEWSMTTPVSYGDWATSWFHYVTFALIIVLAIVFARFYKNKPSHRVYKFVFITAIFMAFFEGLRQLFFVWQSGGSYPWYVFPFQFCSTPIYAGLLIRFVPRTLKETFMQYLGSFSFLGGVLVMLLPNEIYISSVFINFQTTFHHGAMLVMGTVALVRFKYLTFKQFLPSIITFATFVIIAVLMNTLHNELINVPTFNMFFINPLYGTSLPILRDIYPLVPYFIFLIIYILGFTIGAYLIVAIHNSKGLFVKVKKPIQAKA
jgi:hypothetical protein